jgi:hypothetical protein
MIRLLACAGVSTLIATSLQASVAPAQLTVSPQLAAAILKGADLGACSPPPADGGARVAYVRKTFDISAVTLASGEHMIVLRGARPCLGASPNGELKVFERTGNAYTTVLRTGGYSFDVLPNGTAFVRASDSAAVEDRVTYRWNGKTYLVDRTDMVYKLNDVAKPETRVLKFASGTSSVTVTGDQVALGFDDTFDLDAAKGQTLTLDLVKRDAHIGDVNVYGPADQELGTLKGSGLSVKLPETGRYRIVVGGADETFSRYALRIAIR